MRRRRRNNNSKIQWESLHRQVLFIRDGGVLPVPCYNPTEHRRSHPASSSTIAAVVVAIVVAMVPSVLHRRLLWISPIIITTRITCCATTTIAVPVIRSRILIPCHRRTPSHRRQPTRPSLVCTVVTIIPLRKRRLALLWPRSATTTPRHLRPFKRS